METLANKVNHKQFFFSNKQKKKKQAKKLKTKIEKQTKKETNPCQLKSNMESCVNQVR